MGVSLILRWWERKIKIIAKLAKGVKKTLFTSIAVVGEIRLKFEYDKDKWGFIAQEQDEGVSGLEITKRRDIRGRGFLLNWPNKIVANDRSKIYTLKVSVEKLGIKGDAISRVGSNLA